MAAVRRGARFFMAPGSRDVVVDNHLSGLTPSQADAARQTGPVVVLAGAGTGKTKTLVAGIVDRVVKRRMSPDRILAVTFTNKAAGEMKTRIAAALNIAQAPYWVGTFHAHGRRQLRTDPDIAGLRPGSTSVTAKTARRSCAGFWKRRLKQAS